MDPGNATQLSTLGSLALAFLYLLSSLLLKKIAKQPNCRYAIEGSSTRVLVMTLGLSSGRLMRAKSYPRLGPNPPGPEGPPGPVGRPELSMGPSNLPAGGRGGPLYPYWLLYWTGGGPSYQDWSYCSWGL
jgi:hypothetical protein